MSESDNTEETRVYSQDNDTNEFIGTIIDSHQVLSKDGHEMCFLILEINQSPTEVIVFPSVFSTCSFTLEEGKKIRITGNLYRDDESGEKRILPDTIEELR